MVEAGFWKLRGIGSGFEEGRCAIYIWKRKM
jgi:hypothetical protein